MKVSIVIPVYNGEKYLEQCIESVLNQKFQDYELILVNDGSVDRTVEIIEKFVLADTRVKKISIENSGVSVARNVGFNECKGDFVWFVDADDLISPTFLFQIFEIERFQFDILQFQYVKFSQPAPDIVIDGEPKIVQYNNLEDFLEHDTYSRSLWRNLIRASVIKENALQFKAGLRFGEDLLFTLGALLLSERISKTNLAGYFYRVHGDSVMSRSRTIEDAMDHLTILAQLLDLYERCVTSITKTVVIKEIKSIGTTYIAFCALTNNDIRVRSLQKAYNRFYDSEIRNGHAILRTIARLRLFRFSILPVYILFKLKSKRLF